MTMSTRRLPTTARKYALDCRRRHNLTHVPTPKWLEWIAKRSDRGTEILICELCGARMSPTEWQFDHIHPTSKGGASTLENGQITCKDCNLTKGDLDPDLHTDLMDMVRRYRTAPMRIKTSTSKSARAYLLKCPQLADELIQLLRKAGPRLMAARRKQ